MSHHTNIVRVRAVANALGELNEKVVFVGGATLSLYSSREILDVRPTEDVDVIVEIINYTQRVELDEKLRSIGFKNDVGSRVICRWRIEKIVVDIMPTDDPSIGFSNRWYPEGFKNAVNYTISDQCTVKILPAPYFIATKLEAFKGRGGADGRTSHDFEDIIFILENREDVWREMAAATGEIGEYLKSEFSALLNNSNILEWIDVHVERGSPPATYEIHDRMKQFII